MAKTKKTKKKKESSSSRKPRITYYSEPTSLQRYMGFPTIEEQERETKRKRGETKRKRGERIKEQEREHKEKRIKAIKTDIARFFDKPLISKSRRTTKSKGRPLKVSAQAGIRGFWR